MLVLVTRQNLVVKKNSVLLMALCFEIEVWLFQSTYENGFLFG